MTRASAGQHRTARVSPDRLWVGITAIMMVLVMVLLTSMAFSFAAISEAAVWTGLPPDLAGMRFLVPLFIDGAIVTYTLALAVFQWRGDDRRASRRARQNLWIFSILSVALNAAHTGSYWQWDYSSFESWFGTLMAISAPIAALLSAEVVIDLAFTRRATSIVIDPEQNMPAEPDRGPDPEEAADFETELSTLLEAGPDLVQMAVPADATNPEPRFSVEGETVRADVVMVPADQDL